MHPEEESSSMCKESFSGTSSPYKKGGGFSKTLLKNKVLLLVLKCIESCTPDWMVVQDLLRYMSSSGSPMITPSISPIFPNSVFNLGTERDWSWDGNGCWWLVCWYHVTVDMIEDDLALICREKCPSNPGAKKTVVSE